MLPLAYLITHACHFMSWAKFVTLLIGALTKSQPDRAKQKTNSEGRPIDIGSRQVRLNLLSVSLTHTHTPTCCKLKPAQLKLDPNAPGLRIGPGVARV